MNSKGESMRSLDIKELIKNIKVTPYNCSLHQFTTLYSPDFRENFEWLTSRILSNPTAESFNSLSAIFDLIESVESRNVLNIRTFYEQSGVKGREEFLDAYEARSYEQDEFLKEVLEELKIRFKENNSLEKSIKDYVKSFECYELINRRVSPNLNNPVLNDLLNDYCVLEKTEIMTRLEKYVESGWSEIDLPFTDYFLGVENYTDLKQKLFDTMGKRFFHANVNTINIEQFSKYGLSINKEKLLLDRVFKLTPSKAVDYCIEDVNGRLLLGDVFLSTLDSSYKKRWFNALKAVKRHKITNKQDIKYTVSFLTSNPKKSNNYDESFQRDLDFLSLVSTFDTDDLDYDATCAELLTNCNLIIYGNDSDDYINENILVDTPLGINNYAIGAANSILDRVSREEELLEDSVILQQLSEALAGVEVMVSYDEKLVRDLSSMASRIDNVSSRISQGTLSRQLSVYSDRVAMPSVVSNRYQKNLTNYNGALSTYTRNRDYNKNILKQNPQAVSASFIAFGNALNTFRNYFSPALQFSNKLTPNKYVPQLNSLTYAADHLQLGKKISTKIKSAYSHHPAGHSEEYFVDRFLHYSLEALIFYSKGDVYNYVEVLAKIKNHYLNPLIKDPKKFYGLLFSDYQKTNKYNKSIINFGLTLGGQQDLSKNLQNYVLEFSEKLNQQINSIDLELNNVNQSVPKNKL